MKKINESFICVHCGRQIQEAQKTCRNHCPHCFASLHVDDQIPGDRQSNCQGKMYPIAYEIRNGGMKILFKCETCGKEHWNKRAGDDEVTHLDTLIKEYHEIIG